ncbi:hypothetical protein PIROE2DRAFT_17108, partial [Piromyces sp. E2]
MQKDSDEDNPAIFVNSDSGYDYVEIKNSVFENIHANHLYPLINAKSFILEIENTIFSNCHTDYGFLFDIVNKFNDQGHIIIKNTTFTKSDTIFSGNNCKINITDSHISETISNRENPAIFYSKNSIINITNTEFSDLDLMVGLFYENAIYSFINIKFNNITTNAQALLHFLYIDIPFNNVEMSNIKCIGNSSVFLFESDENEMIIDLNNLNVNSCVSNGPFMKTLGNNNHIVIKDSNLSNISSYGPVIDFSSYT